MIVTREFLEIVCLVSTCLLNSRGVSSDKETLCLYSALCIYGFCVHGFLNSRKRITSILNMYIFLLSLFRQFSVTNTYMVFELYSVLSVTSGETHEQRTRHAVCSFRTILSNVLGHPRGLIVEGGPETSPL